MIRSPEQLAPAEQFLTGVYQHVVRDFLNRPDARSARLFGKRHLGDFESHYSGQGYRYICGIDVSKGIIIRSQTLDAAFLIGSPTNESHTGFDGLRLYFGFNKASDSKKPNVQYLRSLLDEVFGNNKGYFFVDLSNKGQVRLNESGDYENFLLGSSGNSLLLYSQSLNDSGLQQCLKIVSKRSKII